MLLLSLPTSHIHFPLNKNFSPEYLTVISEVETIYGTPFRARMSFPIKLCNFNPKTPLFGHKDFLNFIRINTYTRMNSGYAIYSSVGCWMVNLCYLSLPSLKWISLASFIRWIQNKTTSKKKKRNFLVSIDLILSIATMALKQYGPKIIKFKILMPVLQFQTGYKSRVEDKNQKILTQVFLFWSSKKKKRKRKSLFSGL